MKLLLVAAGAALIFGAVLTLAPRSARLSPPEVAVSPARLDLGAIDPGNGPITRTVLVKNTGGKPLDLFRLSTSCGCTTARMDLTPLAAGEERSMTITYDPAVHPDETGPIERAVYLQTSDAKTPEVSIDVVGEITPNVSNL